MAKLLERITSGYTMVNFAIKPNMITKLHIRNENFKVVNKFNMRKRKKVGKR